MDEIDLLHERAARCRRLALTAVDAVMLKRLGALAEEYDAEARALEARLDRREGPNGGDETAPGSR
jgi:hypothetical protein